MSLISRFVKSASSCRPMFTRAISQKPSVVRRTVVVDLTSCPGRIIGETPRCYQRLDGASSLPFEVMPLERGENGTFYPSEFPTRLFCFSLTDTKDSLPVGIDLFIGERRFSIQSKLPAISESPTDLKTKVMQVLELHLNPSGQLFVWPALLGVEPDFSFRAPS